MPGHTLPDEEIVTAFKTKIDALGLKDGKGNDVPVLRKKPGQDQPMPFINFHKSGDTIFTTKDRWGNEQVYVINVWSKKPESSEINDFKSQILETLTDGSFTLPSFDVVLTLLDSDITLPEEQKQEAWHGAMSFRIITQGQNRRP
jgi:hypothetical protein